MSRLRRLYEGETKIDFIGRRRLWFAISAALVLLSVVVLSTRGLNYGIEFEGGVSLSAPVEETGPLADATDLDVISELRVVLEEFGAGEAQIQVARDDEGRSVIVQTKEVADPDQQGRLVTAVAAAVGADIADVDNQRIGSKWGGEITRKAVRALVIFLVVILAFISWRFEWKMGVASIIALLHDLTITAGLYGLVGFEVTPSTVIAILTILGYSLYDTVVVFDKVEEETELYATSGRMTYQDSANLALNQVFMRSLNTSLSTLLPIAGLLFVGSGLLGAGTLKDLSLALFVGLMTGAYSSVYLATPVLSMWKEHEPRYKSVREKVLRDAARAAATSVPAAVPATPADTPDAGPTRTRTPIPARPVARARAGSKKAKRRKRR